MALVRISRLSVQPVSEEEWKIIMKMGGMESVIMKIKKALLTFLPGLFSVIHSPGTTQCIPDQN